MWTTWLVTLNQALFQARSPTVDVHRPSTHCTVDCSIGRALHQFCGELELYPRVSHMMIHAYPQPDVKCPDAAEPTIREHALYLMVGSGS